MVALVVVLVAGCADSSNRAQPSAGILSASQPQNIIVYVSGGVGSPGKQDLDQPFTIEHALQRAGGFTIFEQDQNRKVLIWRNGRQKILVPRKNYNSFILTDGDVVGVGWH